MFKKFLNSTIGKFVIAAMLGIGVGTLYLRTVARPDLVQKECYIPMKVFDSEGTEYHIFMWDSKGNGNEQDIMFFPACQIGWADTVDWGSL